MCLVSFWKTKSGEIVITSNRDEAPERSVNQIQKENYKNQTLIYPQDTKGGSWLFVSSKRTAAVILNGAFNNHKRQDRYRLSRGIVLKEYFSFDDLSAFLNQYNFQNIEPFTMIIFENERLYELRWDGGVKHVEILNLDELHIWSSCTLYTAKQQKSRKDKFIKLFKNVKESPTYKFIKEIHLSGKLDNPEYDFVMNIQDRVKTISVSQLRIKKKQLDLSFENLLLNDQHHQTVAT